MRQQTIKSTIVAIEPQQNRNHPNRRSKTMTTETINPNTMDLDIMSPLEVVTAMNREDEKVQREVEAA